MVGSTRMVDPVLVLVVADTNSAAWPVDRGNPRPDDMGYRAFLRAFNLRDLLTYTPSPLGPTPVSRGPLAPALTRSPAIRRRR